MNNVNTFLSCNEPTSSKNLKEIKLVHQNIQGISRKELEIELFMNCNNIDILCITEHWLKSHQFLFNFNNHVIGSSFSRENAIRGGSLILLNNQLTFKERKDIVSLSVERTIELACVEMEQFVVLCVYRPPSSIYDLFEKVMDDVLLKICTLKKSIFVCGDFNVNLLEDTLMCLKIKNLFSSYNLKYLFSEPTRITDTTATCLDNIYSDVVPTSRQIINQLDSDHCGQMITFIKQNKKVTHKKITVVPKTAGRLEGFKNKLASKLCYLPSTDDPNEQYNSFFGLYCREFDSSFPPKEISVTGTAAFSEWATKGIYISRKKLYELYEERNYNKSKEFANYVKKYSKLFKRICNQAKSHYLSSKIKNSQNKIKMTWDIINKETGKVRNRDTDYSLNVNDKTVKTDLEVATVFEKFFNDIPISTTNCLNSSSTMSEFLLKQNVKVCVNEFNFRHVSASEIVKTFNKLNVKKTADLWGNSVVIAKGIIDIVAPELALIYNKCVDCGVIPDLMKHSKVIPLFKSGSTSDPTNFRPISVLPTFSKIFEKLMLDQLLSHFNRHNLLNSKQFGFTRGRSTTDAGVKLLEDIFGAWENADDALGIFCDLSKAFDCVCHDTLVRKLHHYGVRNTSLNLLISYLDNRIQRVDVNGKRSPGSVVTMGVPQGSILGPFLFLVYINDLPCLINGSNEVVLFADDTSLIFKLKRHQPVIDDVNNTLSKVVHWFSVNNLLLNEKKTKCIKFITPNVRQVKTSVMINESELDLVDTTVFLGITLDSKLQWGPHIGKLSKRLSSAAYAVYKIRQLTDIETARLVYFSYFHSIMSYGILLWGNAADIQTIFVLQKKAIRAIYKLRRRHSLRDKFKEINIMTVASQYIYENLIYIKRNINHYSKYSDLHSFNTRNKDKLVLPPTRLSKIGNSFKCQGVRFYNKLPNIVKELSYNKFKSFVKQKLCQRGYYKVNDYLDDKTVWD